MKVQAIQVLAGLRLPRSRRRSSWRPAARPAAIRGCAAAADAALTQVLGRAPDQGRGGATLLKQADALPPAAAADPRRIDGRVHALASGTTRRNNARRPATRSTTPRGCWRPAGPRRLGHRPRQSPGPAALSGDDAGRGGRSARAGQGARRRSGTPLAREAARFGAGGLNDALEYALTNRLVGAASGRRRSSASSARPTTRSAPAPRPAPLVRAASDSRPPRSHGGPGGDRAAATGRAVGRLQPRAGIALLPRRHQRHAPGAGRRPRRGPAAGLGRDAQHAGLPDRHGRAAAARPCAWRSASPDYEVAFIDTTIDDPPAALLVQQFRHD